MKTPSGFVEHTFVENEYSPLIPGNGIDLLNQVKPTFRGLPAAPRIFFSNQQIKKTFFLMKDYYTFFSNKGCIYERRGVFKQRLGPS